MSIQSNLKNIQASIPEHVTLVAVSKTKPSSDIEEAYASGQRIFGENKVQELCDKFEVLPKDIEWHMIGHLQRNKVKYITPFVSLIHGVDSERLLREINKQAAKNDRIVNCLLQFHIAKEETKFGFSREEILELISTGVFNELKNICIKGVMGMATNTDNQDEVAKEFSSLSSLANELQAHFGDDFKTVSMGMSGDYSLAIENGSNMVRVGSSIFGHRNYQK
jgi:PLP dependent protein